MSLASPEASRRIRAALDEGGGGGVLEVLASRLGVSLAQILDELEPPAVARIAGDRFAEIWEKLTAWGCVLFIVHTQDIVLECSGSLPPGTEAQGYFNIHGSSPIAGHIKASNCKAIYLVDRLFHGRRSCSVQFLNGDGAAMFKVFVRRDEARELVAEQLALFEALKRELGK
ncbi:MAG: heme utilization cystosolic carrier protein HutX [Rhizobiales bacterium]|nr:heme utilization cystosolic carrier protein HutX [Hyphomicrobiales bacterium]